jgi:hypothetical protein
MTLWELYCNPKTREKIDWIKCHERILSLDTRNRIELVNAKGINEKYRLMCRRAQILSAKAFIIEQQLNLSQSDYIAMMIKTISVLEKVKKRAE